MVATVLNTPRAVDMSVYVVRAFIELRTVLAANTALARKLEALERSVVVLDADSRRQFKELRALVFSPANTGSSLGEQPRKQDIQGAGREPQGHRALGRVGREQSEFDHLVEYAPGRALG